jgi:hypothetical protein
MKYLIILLVPLFLSGCALFKTSTLPECNYSCKGGMMLEYENGEGVSCKCRD